MLKLLTSTQKETILSKTDVKLSYVVHPTVIKILTENIIWICRKADFSEPTHLLIMAWFCPSRATNTNIYISGIYIYIYIYQIYIYIYIYIHTYIHTHTCTQTYIYIYIYMCVCVWCFPEGLIPWMIRARYIRFWG